MENSIKCGNGILDCVVKSVTYKPPLTLDIFEQVVKDINKSIKEDRKNFKILLKQQNKEFKESSFGKVYKKLTTDERNNHSMLMLCGHIEINKIDIYRDGGTILININCRIDSVWVKNIDIIIAKGFKGDRNWYRRFLDKEKEIISEDFKQQLKDSLKEWSDYNSKMVEQILKY